MMNCVYNKNYVRYYTKYYYKEFKHLMCHKESGFNDTAKRSLNSA